MHCIEGACQIWLMWFMQEKRKLEIFNDNWIMYTIWKKLVDNFWLELFDNLNVAHENTIFMHTYDKWLFS